MLVNENPASISEEGGLLIPKEGLLWVFDTGDSCENMVYTWPCRFVGNKKDNTAYYDNNSITQVDSGLLPSASVMNDRILSINTNNVPDDRGRVVGNLSCELYGNFSGKYKVLTRINNEDVWQPKTGYYEVTNYHFEKDGVSKTIFMDGKFSGK